MINDNFQPHSIGIELGAGYHKNTGISRYRTVCCALGTLSMDNGTTLGQIAEVINDMKKETLVIGMDSMQRNGGEKAVFVITLPKETNLAKNLEEFGFKMVYEFHRRDCYPQEDLLKLWIYSWE